MTRDDIKKHFPEATDEQISALLDINSRDIGKHKTAADKVAEELTKAKDTIKSLEEAKGDTEALQKQIEEYKAAEAKREEEAKKAKEKADMEKRFTAVLGDKEFASDFARDGVYAKFSAAVNDPANKGKGDAELFTGLTKDVEGVFKSKNPPAKMGGVKSGGNPGSKTKEEIMSIKDTAQRQKLMFENRELFGI